MTNSRSDPSITWYVYVMLCTDGYLYVGISPDPIRRFLDHQRGKSRFSRMRRPAELLAFLPIGPHREAAYEERRLKRQSHNGKHVWVATVRLSMFWKKLMAAHDADTFLAKQMRDTRRRRVVDFHGHDASTIEESNVSPSS